MFVCCFISVYKLIRFRDQKGSFPEIPSHPIPAKFFFFYLRSKIRQGAITINIKLLKYYKNIITALFIYEVKKSAHSTWAHETRA